MAKINPKINRQKAPKYNLLKIFHPLAWLKNTGQRAANLAGKNPRFTTLLLIIIFLILFIIIGTLTPSLQPFEGTLDLNNLTFTSKINQPFLKNADSITEIYSQNPLPLTLTGKFSNSDPKLAHLTSITIQPLKDQESWWQIEAQSKATLEIKELNLTAQTTIEHLEFDARNKRLSIDKITPHQDPLTLTIDSSSSNSFTVNFQGYQIPQFPDVTSFTWTPNNAVKLTLAKAIKLELKFQKIPNDSPFWGRLEVEKVKLFNKPTINQQNYAEYYKESAIAGGTVRLADKNYTLEDGQFLTFDPQDSISDLLRLKLTQESPPTLKTSDNKTLQINQSFQGLKVDISGKTKKIEIGLNDRLPVANLQASWLEKYIPRDAAIALITFLTTLVTILLGWLWELLKSEETANEK